MNRINTIKYISETSVKDIVQRVKVDGMDVLTVIEASLESRKEYGIKVQQLVDELKRL
ncbi:MULTISPECIES: hypothetical protein [Paenibacillus]|uniref:hypothetical protein n=1 Tax=Paenibacillus TaxID=44249 RepID=UPI0015C3C2F6|nr:hypothetical protein [Paenibacillus odorifer]